MNDQSKYFGLSAGLHAFLLMLLFGLSAAAVKRPCVMTIDFSLNDSPPFCAPEQRKTPPPAVPSRPQTLPDTPRPIVEPPPQSVPVTTSTPARVEPAAQAVAAVVQPSAQQTGQRLETAAATGVSAPAVASVRPAAPSSGGSPAGESSVEQVRKKYLKEHFSYIRDLIVKRLNYPPVARRMEWSGKVVLAFVVAEDGAVRSVQIKESSGHSVLDNSAIDTVKRVAPFPRPPVAAEIVMPVMFRLE